MENQKTIVSRRSGCIFHNQACHGRRIDIDHAGWVGGGRKRKTGWEWRTAEQALRRRVCQDPIESTANLEGISREKQRKGEEKEGGRNRQGGRRGMK